MTYQLKCNKNTSGIYRILNNVNSKSYIGKSIRLYHRKYQHFVQLRSNRHQNSYLQYAFNKYGADNFSFEVLEICDENILGQREHYWIKHLDTNNRKKGYNLEEIQVDGRSKKSIETITKLISTIARNGVKRSKGKDNPTSRIVYQYSIDGIFIASYDSCHIAAECIGNKELYTVISKCARLNKGSSGAYQWRYVYTPSITKCTTVEDRTNRNKENNIILSKPIVAIDLHSNQVIEFNSLSEASKITGLAISCITKIAKGERYKSTKLNMTFKFKQT
jgi:group I intron endonuclease